MCRERDSNPHGPRPSIVARGRAYQFRHPGTTSGRVPLSMPRPPRSSRENVAVKFARIDRCVYSKTRHSHSRLGQRLWSPKFRRRRCGKRAAASSSTAVASSNRRTYASTQPWQTMANVLSRALMAVESVPAAPRRAPRPDMGRHQSIGAPRGCTRRARHGDRPPPRAHDPARGRFARSGRLD